MSECTDQLDLYLTGAGTPTLPHLYVFGGIDAVDCKIDNVGQPLVFTPPPTIFYYFGGQSPALTSSSVVVFYRPDGTAEYYYKLVSNNGGASWSGFTPISLPGGVGYLVDSGFSVRSYLSNDGEAVVFGMYNGGTGYVDYAYWNITTGQYGELSFADRNATFSDFPSHIFEHFCGVQPYANFFAGFIKCEEGE